MTSREDLIVTISDALLASAQSDKYGLNAVTEADLEAVPVADAILAAGYRKLEPRWAETLTNDGTYEYTVSSDCDGSNVQHWRRTPGTVCIEDASPWEAYEPEVKL